MRSNQKIRKQYFKTLTTSANTPFLISKICVAWSVFHHCFAEIYFHSITQYFNVTSIDFSANQNVKLSMEDIKSNHQMYCALFEQ